MTKSLLLIRSPKMSKQRLHKNIPLAKAVTMATDTADNSIAPPADATAILSKHAEQVVSIDLPSNWTKPHQSSIVNLIK